MLRLALMFMVVALIAAVLGFSGVTALSANVAKVGFFIFAGLFTLKLVLDALDERSSSM